MDGAKKTAADCGLEFIVGDDQAIEFEVMETKSGMEMEPLAINHQPIGSNQGQINDELEFGVNGGGWNAGTLDEGQVGDTDWLHSDFKSTKEALETEEFTCEISKEIVKLEIIETTTAQLAYWHSTPANY